MGRMSKTKGAKFEILICKMLSRWVSKYKNENLFWRSSQSGGRATVVARKGKKISRLSGDIAAIDPLGDAFADTFYVECKCTANLNLRTLLYPDMVGFVVPWWITATKEADRYGKIPILIMKENARPIIAILPREIPPTLGMNGKRLIEVASFRGDHCRAFRVHLFEDILAFGYENLLNVARSVLESRLEGFVDENDSHGGLTSRRPPKQRIPLDLSDLDEEPRVRRPRRAGRSNRRERLP